MGKLIGNPFGEIRGKVGGVVFSRNKHGPIVRAYVKPVQANSVAQTNQRARFASLPTVYKSLTQAQKRLWSSYAVNGFIARHTTNKGRFTGQNAFVSINMLLSQVNDSMNAITMKQYGVPLDPLKLHQSSFVIPQLIIPVSQVSAFTIRKATPTLILQDQKWQVTKVTKDFGVTFTFEVVGYTDFSAPGTYLKFFGSDNTNIMCTMSEGLDDSDARPKDFDRFTIASTGKFWFTSEGAFGSKYEIKIADRTDMSNYDTAPTVGKTVYITLYAIGDRGTHQILHRQKITVT
jgi:hypothetical protein